MPLELRVHGLAGELCSVVAERGWMVRTVKDAIEASIDMPWWEQRLCFESTELPDEDRLGASLRAAGADTSVESLDVSVFRARVDRDQWISLLERRPLLLNEAPPPILADGEAVLTALRADVWALAYATKELRGDLGFALAAVRQNGLALRHLAPGPRAERGVVLAAVRQNGQALKFAGDAFQADREIVLAAMGQESSSLVHAAPELLLDRDFVLLALQQDWRVLRYLKPEMRTDPEIVHRATGQGLPVAMFLAEPLGEEIPNEDELWIDAEPAYRESDNAIFIDARGAKEFELSRIEGAHNEQGITLEQMICIERTPVFSFLQERKEMTVVVYSDNGFPISRCANVARALRAHKEVDADRVLRLQGGLNAWKSAGLPVAGDAREMYLGTPIVA